MDEKSIALAENLPKVAEAIETMVVPGENAAEILAALAEDAEDGDVNIGNLIGQFDKFPESATPAAESAGESASALEDVNAAGEPTVTMLENLATNAGNTVGPMEDAAAAARSLELALTGMGQAGAGVPVPSTSGAPHAQMGLRVPGRIGQPRMIMAHGGEIVSNPYQHGAIGGPGGPPTTNHYGGDTNFNVNINDRMAAALFLDQMRRQRYDRLSGRM
jgi:hypothetical protein